MNNIANDNRFEVIEKAKKHILEATNIDTSKEEMLVLDNFLFRCWQMGWLVRYDTNNEEVLNNTLKLIDNLAYNNACCRCQYYKNKICTNKDKCAWVLIKDELQRIVNGKVGD